MYASGANAPHDVSQATRRVSRGVDLSSDEARRELGLLLLRGESTRRISNTPELGRHQPVQKRVL
jgi:hypothetical protein